MLKIKVLLWGQLKLAIQTDSVELDLPEPYTTPHAVRTLAHAFPPLKDLLLDEDQARASILMFVNGTQVLEGEDSVLADGMELTLMSPIAGG